MPGRSLTIKDKEGYSYIMAMNLKELEKELCALSTRDKAALARTLIEDLDRGAEQDVEAVWIEEANRRYEAYKIGGLGAVSGEEAMQRARQRLK